MAGGNRRADRPDIRAQLTGSSPSTLRVSSRENRLIRHTLLRADRSAVGSRDTCKEKSLAVLEWIVPKTETAVADCGPST
jgi:hypothetical protein